MYLTYIGLLYFLFTSRLGKTMPIIQKSTKILFTMQFGSAEQKEKCITEALGFDPSSISSMFDKRAKTISCIYLFSLGYVKDLRKSMNIRPEIPDNYIVYKYGRTDDLPRRSKELVRLYNKIEGVNIRFVFMNYIDPIYNSEAETKVRNLIKSINAELEYLSFKELIVLSDEQKITVEKHYSDIGHDYMSQINEINKKMKRKEEEIEILKKDFQNEIIILKKDHEIELLKRDLEIQKRDYELKLLKTNL